MSIGYASRWRRVLHKVPFLFKKCPDGNYHWQWDRYCGCRIAEHIYGTPEEGDWHGGVYCFRHRQETGLLGLQPQCPCLK